MPNIIKYDLITAYKLGINKHPQEDVKNLGMVVLKFEGVPMGDFVIMKVTNMPNVLPDYITETEWNFESK